MPAVRFSRYEYASAHEDEQGRVFLDVPDPVAKRHRPDDEFYVVGEGDTLMSIAWRFYRSLQDREQDLRPEGFYWVIAMANDIVDVTEEIEPGTRLRIPSIPTILNEITAPPAYFRGSQ